MKRFRFIAGGAMFFAGFVSVAKSLTMTGFSVSVAAPFSGGLIYPFGGLGLMMAGVMIANSGLERKVKRGVDLDVNVSFVRHGEKDSEGFLTRRGGRQAQKYGKGLGGDVAKIYSSPVPRVISTAYNALDGFEGKKAKGKVRVRGELAPLEEFSGKFFEAYAKDHEGVINKWYQDGGKRFDKGTVSSEEVASGFAYLLDHYVKMSGRLNKGSDVDLVNGTHEVFSEALLHEVLIRYDEKGRKVRGFDKAEDIGGTLGYAEGMQFKIHRDSKGEVDVGLEFRGKRYDVDMERLGELAGKYKGKK